MSDSNFHAVQDQGARDYQEDNWAALPPVSNRDGLLLLVCDGMGGHQGGRLASKTVARSFATRFEAMAEEDIQSRLRSALTASHQALKGAAQEDPLLISMGTTLVSVYVRGDDLYWLSIGDSPLYLIQNKKLSRINEDHSMTPVLNELVETGQMSKEDAASDRRRNMLRSVVGTDEISLIDQQERLNGLRPGDVLILASDGVETLAEKDILAVAVKHRRKGPQRVAEAVLKKVLARRNPHQDNVTIAVYIHGPSERPQAGFFARLFG